MRKIGTAKLRICCFALCCLLLLGCLPLPVAAHNKVVHEKMTMRAVNLMMRIGRARKAEQILGTRPPGVTAAQWKDFQNDIANSSIGLREMAGESLDTYSGLIAEGKLAFAASWPDYYLDDVHLFIKVSNIGGQSWIDKASDNVIETGATGILVPFVCAGLCLGDLIGLSDCDDCIDAAKKLGSKVPTPSDLKNLFPGAGDDTDEDYVGLWHFINMSDGQWIENEYDDHQGILYERAGPTGSPGSIDILIMAGADLIGKTINPAKSQGVKRYQRTDANDPFPDGDSYTNTKFRSNFEWEKYSLGHTVLSPVDNFALWGWRGFRNDIEPDPSNRFLKLGYSLHALGDATVPMHVTGTTSHGHRPYEDAQERLWDKISTAVSEDVILAKAFAYRREIQKWRQQGNPGDIPMRHLVRTVARNTFSYSKLKQASTAWPFKDLPSFQYFVGGSGSAMRDQSVNAYMNFPNAVSLVKPLIEDGIAAELAVLMSAPEGVVAQQNSPLKSDASFFVNANLVKDTSFSPKWNLASPSAEEPDATKQTIESKAQARYYEAVRIDYRRLARMLVHDQISPAEYLQRIWDRTRKSKTAKKDEKLAEEFVRGDKDGDLIPDSRDKCPGTRPVAATDDRGCPTREKLPQAPSRSEMQRLFAQMNFMESPECDSASSPETPQQLKAGVSSIGESYRNPTFSVKPVENQPSKCPVYYDFAVRFENAFPFHRSYLPVNAEKEVIFRHTDGQLLGSGDQKRMLFRVMRTPPSASPEQPFYIMAWATYNSYQWRVRAVNGNGLSSPWSAWKVFNAIEIVQ